jgi:hypothetical protein
LANGARQTVVHDSQFDLHSAIKLQTLGNQWLIGDALPSMIIDEKKSWFL